MKTNQNYYSQTLVVYYMELKLKVPAKILAAIKKCLISVIIGFRQNIKIIQTN